MLKANVSNVTCWNMDN